MAKADLVVNVGTKYNGDALKKLNAGIRDSAKVAKSAGQALGSITSELGQMGGAAGKAAGAVSGLMSAMMAGGPVAIAIGAITTAIGFVVKAFKDAKEAAKEAAQTMRESFSSAIDGIETRLNGLQSMFASLKKWKSEAIENSRQSFDLDTRDEKANLDIKYQKDREGMTNQYDKARNKAEQAYNQGLLDTNIRGNKTQANRLKLEEQAGDLRNEIEAMRSEIADMEHTAAQQFVSTVDAEVANEYKTLQENLKRAQEEVLKNGKDAVARKETQTITTGTSSSGAVMTKQVEVSYTYAQEMESAAKLLNEFKKKNEESLKGLDSYNKTVEKIDGAKKKVIEKENEYGDLLAKVELAQAEEAIVGKELEAQRRKLEETYKEQIEAIDKQEKAEKETKEKLTKAEQERAQKEEEAKQKTEKRNEILDKIDKREEEYSKEVGNLKDKSKTLAQKQQELAIALKKAEDAAKDMKAGFDAAGAVANAMGQNNPWQGAQNAQGGVNQWIGQNNANASAAKKEAGRIGRNIEQAQGQQARLAGRIFDKNGNVRGGANIMDIGRFSDITDFLGGKGITDEQKNGLQAQADKLRKRLYDSNGNLKKSVNPMSRDVQQLEKVEGLLGKFKQLEDVKKLKEDKDKLDKQKADLEKQANEAQINMARDIKDLRTELKNLSM